MLILTNCTSRKRQPPAKGLRARDLHLGSCTEVTREWARRVRAASRRFPAQHLYCGRAAFEALRIADRQRSSLVFVSAGLGIVDRQDDVPGYSLTATSRGIDSIARRVRDRLSPQQWWSALVRALGSQNELARIARDHADSLVLVALPTTYLKMISVDLLNFPGQTLRRLRIIGPRRLEDIPDGLQSQWMPYDARFDNLDIALRGTEGDFAQRALAHFVDRILEVSPRGGARRHQDMVAGELEALKPYVRSRGVATPDANLISVIETLWETYGGNRGLILRHIRSEMGLACEQSRFRRLVSSYANTKASAA